MQNPEPEPVLQFCAATYTYRAARRSPTRTIGPVSLTITRGERVALVGGNGSGKSTLINLACGATSPAQGEVRWFAGRPRSEARRRLGVVFQHKALDDLLTVRETLQISARLLLMPAGTIEPRINELAGQLEITDRLHDRIGSLSGGLARRVDLARAIMHEPDLLLLDEATAGLDESSADAFNTMLDRLSYAGVTVVAATHTPEEVRRATRVITLRDGMVTADESAERESSVGTP